MARTCRQFIVQCVRSHIYCLHSEYLLFHIVYIQSTYSSILFTFRVPTLPYCLHSEYLLFHIVYIQSTYSSILFTFRVPTLPYCLHSEYLLFHIVYIQSTYSSILHSINTTTTLPNSGATSHIYLIVNSKKGRLGEWHKRSVGWATPLWLTTWYTEHVWIRET